MDALDLMASFTHAVHVLIGDLKRTFISTNVHTHTHTIRFSFFEGSKLCELYADIKMLQY